MRGNNGCCIIRYSASDIICWHIHDRLGSLSAREFNCLGKYTLHMGNVTSGNIINAIAIGELMS